MIYAEIDDSNRVINVIEGDPGLVSTRRLVPDPDREAQIGGTWSEDGFAPASVAAMSADEISAARQAAYQREADPLYFKWQRNEATQAEWLAKIAEIRARYPDL